MLRTIFKNQVTKEELLESLKRRIKKIKKEFGMFKKDLMVAVSGGKDSSALSFLLKELGYEPILYHINLNLGNFSNESLNAVKKLSDELNLELVVEDIRDYGVKIQRMRNIPPCSVCGTVKRYLTNKYAFENNLEVITGHVLEDYLSFIVKAIYSGNLQELARLKPYLEENKEYKIAARSKPLILISEIETKELVEAFNIPYTSAKCINAKKAATNDIKEKYSCLGMQDIYSFVFGTIRISKDIKQEIKLKKCKICGFPTTNEVCKFCKIRSILGSL